MGTFMSKRGKVRTETAAGEETDDDINLFNKIGKQQSDFHKNIRSQI